MAENVVINLKANDQATVNIEKVFKQMNALSKSVNDFVPKQKRAAQEAADGGGAFDKAAEAAKKLAAAYLGLSTAQKAIEYLRESVVASANQEAIFTRLGASIEGVGGDWSKLRGEVEAFADAQQRTTRFGDTETAQAMQRLITLTGTYRGALDAVRLAEDFAEGSGRSLSEATNMVAKGLTGNLEALGEVIPQARILARTMGESATLSQKAEAAVRLLNESYGGMSQKVGDGTVALSRIKNALGDVSEAVGDNIRKWSLFRTTVSGLADAIEDTSKLLSGANLGGEIDYSKDKGIRADVDKFIENLRATGDASAATTTMQRKMSDALSTLISQQRAYNATLKDGEIRVVNNEEMERQERIDDLTFKLNLYAQAQAKLNAELSAQASLNAALKPDDGLDALLARIEGDLNLDKALKNLKGKAAEAAKAQADELAKIDREQRAILDQYAEEQEQGHQDRLLQIRIKHDDEMLRLDDERMQASLAMTQQIESALQNIAIRSVENLGSSFGKFIASGKFAPRQFGLAMVGAIGEMSVAMGSFFIATGIGLESLKALQGAAAIAAGASLVALGGALSAAASAFGGKKSGRVSTPIPSDFTTANPSQPQQQERVLRVEFNSSGTNDAENALAEVFRIGFNRASEQGGLGLVPA